MNIASGLGGPMILQKLSSFLQVDQNPWTYVQPYRYDVVQRSSQITIKDRLPDWIHDHIDSDLLNQLEILQVDTKHHLLHSIVSMLKPVEYFRRSLIERRALVNHEIDAILKTLNEDRIHPIVKGFGKTKLQSQITDDTLVTDGLYW